MSRPLPRRSMSRLFRRLGAACAALLLVAIACRDRTLTGPGLPRPVSIALAPRFQAGAESAQPISRIRAAVQRVDEQGVPIAEAPLAETELSVDPAATSWPVALDFATTAPVRVVVSLELIHLAPAPNGTSEVVEWAARVGPMVVRPGATHQATDVRLGRGPLPNLDVTGVGIGTFPTLLLLGDVADLTASMTPGNLPGTRLYWGALDPAVARIDAAGHVTSVGPGTARFTATAGLASDTINVTVADPVALVASLVVDATSQDQQAMAGAAVPQPIRVRAIDAAQLAVRGVPVTFAVASGGGSITGATTLITDDAGTVQLGGWTLGAVAGANTLTATVQGRTISTTVRATGLSPAVATSLELIEGTGQQVPAGTAVTIAPAVRVLDQNGQPLAGVPVTFTVDAGSGTVGSAATNATSETVTSNEIGIARVSAWTLGQAVGTNTLVASAGTLPTVSFTATGIAGPAASMLVVSGNDQPGTAGTALAQPLVGRVVDRFGNSVANVVVSFATPDGGSFANVADTSDAQGLVQATWTPGLTSTAQTATMTAAGVATPATFAATVTLPPQQVTLALANADKVSQGRTQVVNVTLPTPAPAAGTGVTVTSDAPSVLAVQGSGTITIAAGQTTGTVQVSGLAEGSATLRAVASGNFQDGVLPVQVELRVLGVPTTLNVPFGQAASLPINIARAAPAGGLTVQVTTSDATKVDLASATAFIAAGATTGTVTLNGVNPGPSEIVVSHPLYTPDTTAATTTAALDVLNATYTINTSFGAATPVRFLSNGVPVPAPAPGVTVNVVSRTPTCVSVPATLTIPTGLTTATLDMQYNAQGGTTTFPCTSRVVVSSSAGIATDSATVTVNAQPAISVTTASLGQGLQRTWAATLGASNHGGTTVRITSPDPQVLLVAPDASTPGSAFIDVPVIAGGTQANFHVQALDAARTGAYAITATATGFTGGTGTATVVTPALDVQGVNIATTSLSADDDFYVRIGIANGQNTSLVELQDRRVGGTPLVATATVSDGAVVQVVTGAGIGTTGTTSVAAGQSNSPTTRATGGFALRPMGNGTATVTASIPGFTTVSPGGTVSVTVTTPAISASGATVGAGLQKAMSASLGAGAPTGGTTVRIASTDPTILKVSPNATTPGTDFIDVVVAAGGTSIPYHVQGMEDMTGSPAVTLDAPGYAGGRATFPVVTPAIDLQGVSTSTTTLSVDDDIYARLGIANGQSTSLNELQDVRAGGRPVVVTFSTGTPTVGTLVTTAGVQGTVATATIAVGQSNTPTTVATAGVALRPLAAGTTRLGVSAPGTITTSTGGFADVTVAQPTQTLNGATVGAGLQKSMGGGLQTGNHGGVTVRLTSSDPTRVLLARTATSAGAATLDIALANGTSSYSYYIQGLEGQVGTATVTATTPGFATATATMTVATPFLDLQGVNAATTTLSVNDDIYARVGIANAQGSTLNELQDVRFGGDPIVVTFSTSSVGVAQLVPSQTNGATATATIPVGQSNSPTTVATGGVALDPLTAGTTTVTMTGAVVRTGITIPVTSSNGSQVVTVSAPAITLSTGAVGAGLQRTGSISLGAPAPTGGLTVRLTSSQPAVMLLSPLATTAGTDFIDVTIAAGFTSASFLVHGVDGQVGTPTISAKATGFADGTIAQPVVTPALDVQGLNTSINASGANDDFYVRIGIANATNTVLNELQDRRAGQPALVVTFSNSAANVAQLATTTGTGQSLTRTLAAGQSNTPTTLATGGIALDPLSAGSTQVTATIPGFTTTNAGTVNVTVLTALAAMLR